MSHIKPLVRYDAAMEYDAPEPHAVMRESSGGLYINEDELRDRLKKMLAEAGDPGETDALRSVLAMIDEPNW